MKQFFKTVNENSIVYLNTALINDFFYCDDIKSMNTFERYLLQMSSVDKTLLNDRNLGALEALEVYFGKSELSSFEGKSKTYKKYFLNMLKGLCEKEMVSVLNGNEKINIVINKQSQLLDIEYTGEKLCDRKDNSLAISNIKGLSCDSLDEIRNKYEQYKLENISLDSQVEFVLRNYFNYLKASESYIKGLPNWKHDIISFGKSEYSLFEHDFLLLDKVVLDYFDYLMTLRVQADLERDDIKAKVILEADNQIALLILKKHSKQKNKNMQ